VSNAKLCDACGRTFAEGEEGSESGVGAITRTIDGRTVTEQKVRDFCNECVQGRYVAPRPQLSK
jgi:hypothetical protein